MMSTGHSVAFIYSNQTELSLKVQNVQYRMRQGTQAAVAEAEVVVEEEVGAEAEYLLQKESLHQLNQN